MSQTLDEKLDSISKRLFERDKTVITDIDLLIIETNKNEDTYCEAELYGFKAIYYRILRENEKAFSALDKAESLLTNKLDKDINLIGWLYKLRSSVYHNEGNFIKSDEYNLKALEICEKRKDIRGAANVMNDLGQAYLAREDYKKADYYLTKSLKYFLEVDKNAPIWMIYNALGKLNLAINELNKAELYFNNAIDILKNNNNEVGLILSLDGLSNVLFRKNEHNKAFEKIDDAIGIAEKNGTLMTIEATKLSKIYFHLYKNESSEALIILNTLDYEQMPEPSLIQVYAFFSEAYEKESDFENSLKFLHKNVVLKEKLLGIEAKKHSEEMESKFQNELKEREKEILRLQKVEMEQKALRAQLNPHFFFNSLNSINKFITDNDAENASKFLFKFSSLMRKTLENSEESFITIEEEVDYLKDYLSLEQLRFNFSFHYEIKVDEEIEDDFIKIPTMMLQPYVENCIKHGINGVENGKIKIEFKLITDNKICCIIEDNGIGVGESKSTHKSMGTSILENRLKNLREQSSFECSVEVLNLYNKDKNTSGTRVELEFTI